MTLPQWTLTVSTLLAGSVLLGVLARRLRLPLTVVLAAFGFLAGWLGGPLGIESPLEGAEFEEILVFIFLPVLVFAAASNLSTRTFFRNLAPILVLAIPALVVSAVLVGVTLRLGLGTPLVAALVFGVLISATDPVAVVAIFRELGVPERLLTLVEGESMLNDGVAIVGYNVLLAAALGVEVSVLGGAGDFLLVFFGGAVIGTMVGFAAASILPWLDRLSAAALSVAVAYGGFVLTEHLLGFSGVMATVASGVVLGGLAPSRASAAIRELWDQLWEALEFIANALLFLLVGLAIDPRLILENLGAMVLAIAVVLAARPLAVVPLASVLERFAGIPRVGRRNETVLVWGGLRGGVALALALALPESLPQREAFIAMTGGVVLATLLVNATTIGPLVRRLGLDRPGRTQQYLAGVARLSGIEAARKRLVDLNLFDSTVWSHLDSAERQAHRDLEKIELTDDEKLHVAARQALFVERASYQRLHDAGLLPPSAARTLLNEAEDRIEEISLGHAAPENLRPRELPRVEAWAKKLAAALPGPFGTPRKETPYAEASARRIAAHRAGEALDIFERLPGIDASTVEPVKAALARREQEAGEVVASLEHQEGPDGRRLRQRQAEVLGRVAAADKLRELSESGLLPEATVRRVVQAGD